MCFVPAGSGLVDPNKDQTWIVTTNRGGGPEIGAKFPGQGLNPP